MLLAVMLAACCTSVLARSAMAWTVATWAQNTRDGIEKFGFTQLRSGCSDTPEECVRLAQSIRQSEGVETIAIGIALDRADTALLRDYAARYAACADRRSGVAEISIDDFYSFMRRNKLRDFPSVLAAAKGINSDLRFSITLYEDDLDAIAADESLFTAELNDRVQRIYLYLHYRANANNYADYVSRTRALFPQAEIFGGSYAYDRIDYIACAEGPDTSRCNRDREIELFRTALMQQVALLRSGVLAGLEFYPGQFGREQDWDGWNNPKICRAKRRAECIEITRKMRHIAGDILMAK